MEILNQKCPDCKGIVINEKCEDCGKKAPKDKGDYLFRLFDQLDRNDKRFFMSVLYSKIDCIIVRDRKREFKWRKIFHEFGLKVEVKHSEDLTNGHKISFAYIDEGIKN